MWWKQIGSLILWPNNSGNSFLCKYLDFYGFCQGWGCVFWNCIEWNAFSTLTVVLLGNVIFSLKLYSIKEKSVSLEVEIKSPNLWKTSKKCQKQFLKSFGHETSEHICFQKYVVINLIFLLPDWLLGGFIHSGLAKPLQIYNFCHLCFV